MTSLRPETATTPVDSADVTGTIAGAIGQAHHDLSVWGLFMQADIVVKLVMLILLFMSVWCWTIVPSSITFPPR